MCFLSREPFIILSGGLSYDTVGRRPCLTVMHGKSTAVLEMDYPIVDFLTLCETPYPNGKLFIFKANFMMILYIPGRDTFLFFFCNHADSPGKEIFFYSLSNFISEV